MAMGKQIMISSGKTTVAKSAIKKASSSATQRVDKYQNKALVALNKKVNKLAKIPELKNYVDNSGTINVTTSGQWYSAFSKNIVTGLTDNDRIGDQIRCKSLHIKGTINLMPPMASVAVVRLILVRYKDNYYNTNPSIVDLLNTNDYRSFYNTETQKDEYSILYDKTFNLNQTTKPQVYFSIHKNLSNAYAKWNPGTISTGPASGHYFMYLISDQSATSVIEVNFTHMLYFVD